MFLRTASILTLSVAVLGFAAPAFAAPDMYKLETPHTQVMFSVSHVGFSHSYGKFTTYDGEISLDPKAPEKSFVRATIKTDSLQMSNDLWNEHLKGANFFDVTKYPDMTFTSTAVKMTGEHTADVTGDLTLHGVTKPVTLKVTHNKSDMDPFSNVYKSGFSATGTIKRSDFGMTYGLPAVGDDVAIIIEVEGIRQDSQEQKANGQ